MTFNLNIKAAHQVRAESLDAARHAATIAKSAFCIGLADMEIITDEDCVAAAKGEWPEGFRGFLDYLSPAEARNARTLWAATGEVSRMDGTIIALAWWFNILDEKLDTLFEVNASTAAP